MKKILAISLVIEIIFTLTGCSLIPKNNILKKIEINNAKCKLEKDIDTHKGFLGDGEYFAKIKCSNLNYKKLSNNWKQLPLSNELNNIMENTYEKYPIPHITNGYYYFLDRHSNAKNKHDETNLNNRYSYNFTLAFIDINTNIIYYYELDT